MKRIPVESPFDEYETMRTLRCDCGGAFAWGERTCERLDPPEERYVVDRFTMTCSSCAKARPIEFLCDTGSDLYTGLAKTAFDVALGLGPDGAAALLAASAGVGERERPAKPKRASGSKKTKTKPKQPSKRKRRSR